MGNKYSKTINNNEKIYSPKKQINSNYVEDNNDEFIIKYNRDEDDRLNEQHFIIQNAFKGLDIKTFSNFKDKEILILDAGCGNGTWCLYMSSNFPNAKFYGVDIKNIYPKDIKLNCEFEKIEISEYLKKTEKNSFDIITQRFMAMDLKKNEWKALLDDYYRVLKTGGYLIIVESDLISSNMGFETIKFSKNFEELLKNREIDPYINNSLCKLINSTKFILKDKKDAKIYLFEDPEIKDTYGINIMTSLKNMKFDDNMTKFLSLFEEECRNNKTHNFTYCYILYKN
jgi:ubiquinone/menaquinone biosynthesis C-methylase UbiE